MKEFLEPSLAIERYGVLEIKRLGHMRKERGECRQPTNKVPFSKSVPQSWIFVWKRER